VVEGEKRELRRSGTRPMASAGKAGDCPHSGRRPGRPLSRGGAAEAVPPTPGGRPCYRSAGGDQPLRKTRQRVMRNPGRSPSSVPGIVSPRKIIGTYRKDGTKRCQSIRTSAEPYPQMERHSCPFSL
jgi:hypothetical protein